MLLIDPTDIKLEKGSDYDDHFILSEKTESDKILGKIDLQKYRPVEQNTHEIINEIIRIINERT